MISTKRIIMWISVISSILGLPIVADAQVEKNKPRISFKLTGGMGSYRWGDANTYIKSLNEASSPIRTNNGFDEIKNRWPAWEAEVRADVARKFAIGLSLSAPIREENRHRLEYHLPWGDSALDGWIQLDRKIKVSMPVKLGLYYSLFSNSKINVLINGGLGLYSMDFSERREYKNLDIYILFSNGLEPETTVRDLKAHSHGKIGYHLGIDIEYNISKRLAFVVAGQARHIKINNLTGSVGEENGDLCFYLHKNSLMIVGIEFLDWRISPPGYTGKNGNINDWYGKRAVFDLSGFSLSAGFRIKLF